MGPPREPGLAVPGGNPVATRVFPDGGRIPEGGLPGNPIPPRETGRAAEGL